MLLLTAREGRLSANQLGCPSSRSSQTLPTFAHVPRRRIRVSRAPAQRRSQRQNRQFCGCFISALTFRTRRENWSSAVCPTACRWSIPVRRRASCFPEIRASRCRANSSNVAASRCRSADWIVSMRIFRWPVMRTPRSVSSYSNERRSETLVFIILRLVATESQQILKNY